MPNVGPPRIVVTPSRAFTRQEVLDNVRAARNRGTDPLPGGVVISPTFEDPNEFRSRTLAQNGVGITVDRVG